MPKYAAFLRGINVSNRRVTGPELRACFESLGLRDVAAFRASGNVVFVADAEAPRALTARIEEGLAAALGYEVATFLRTAREVQAIAGHAPFAPAAVEASAGKLQVAMLTKRPTQRARDGVLALATDQDRLALGDRELYWLPSGGTMESELDRDAIVRLLGLMTFRTMNTIEQIARKHFAE